MLDAHGVYCVIIEGSVSADLLCRGQRGIGIIDGASDLATCVSKPKA